MKLEELKKMVKKGESSTLEFKKSTANLKEAFRTICGMLNKKGGKILIGVNDKGVIRGQEIGDSTRKNIAEHIRKIEPTANIDVEYVRLVEDKYVIVLDISSEQNIQGPYIYDGRPYQRIESATSIMKQTKYHELLYFRDSCFSHWESQPSAYECSAKMLSKVLDKNTIREEFIARGVQCGRLPATALKTPILELLSKLGLIYESYNMKRLTHAALILFGRDLERKYSQSLLKMARFKGTSKSKGFIDEKEFYGNAFEILRQAENFIRSYLPIAGSFTEDSFRRKDEPAVPYMAIREALVNAICHREYNNPIGQIAVAVYDDRLEIWSRGELPNKLTAKKLTKKHLSCPRNKLISDIFYKCGYIEKWGYGTLRIIELCKEEGAPEPIYSEYTGGFSVEFMYKSVAIAKTVIEADTATKPLPRLTKRQKNILNILKKLGGEAQSKEIAEKTKVSQRLIQMDLNKLRELHLVVSIGVGKKTFWKLMS